MYFVGVNWRVNKVRIACKTGFFATVFFCLIELLLLPRSPYEDGSDVAVQGVLKKKLDVVDYGFDSSSKVENNGKRRLSSDRWYFAGGVQKSPPKLDYESRNVIGAQLDTHSRRLEQNVDDFGASFDIPGALTNGWEYNEEGGDYGVSGGRGGAEEPKGNILSVEGGGRKRHNHNHVAMGTGGAHRDVDTGQARRSESEVFIQLNRTRAISSHYQPIQDTPRSKNSLSRGDEDIIPKRTLPFENPRYVWRKDGPGEMGKAVVPAVEDIELADSLFGKHQFNVFVSDQIALNRSLPDHRPQRCRMFRYGQALPRASVIIVFHNEARSVLLRTIWSVITRSPSRLLEEIVLVDDASTLNEDWTGSWLDDYLALLPVPTLLIRMPSRRGVVGARLAGVSAASPNSRVLVFLDSHCECTDGWLEPLLDCIHRNSTRVVSPAIDSISDTDFSYTYIQGMARTGGFTWFPEFMWTHAAPREMKRVWHDTATPLRTPTIAGGLFAIDRVFFEKLGYYDPELRVWGSENLELSFKVWQCGGSLEVVPCSRVGHVFRAKPPYDFPGDPESVLLRNNKRVLEVWGGEVKHIFYALTPEYLRVDPGDLSSRIRLRDELQCKSFEWYLDTVYPEHILPTVFQALGRLMNKANNQCLDVLSASDGRRMGAFIALNPCREGALAQTFSWNMGSQLQHDHYCITSREGDRHVMLLGCQDVQYDRRLTNQQWQYIEETGSIRHHLTGLCMGLLERMDQNVTKSFAILEKCSSVPTQEWTILETFVQNSWR